jgi:hypothetical protein
VSIEQRRDSFEKVFPLPDAGEFFSHRDPKKAPLKPMLE